MLQYVKQSADGSIHTCPNIQICQQGSAVHPVHSTHAGVGDSQEPASVAHPHRQAGHGALSPTAAARSPGGPLPSQPPPLVAAAHRVSWTASCWSCGSGLPASWATRRRRGWARGRHSPWPCAATARAARWGSACPASAAHAGPPRTRTAPWRCGRAASAGPCAEPQAGCSPLRRGSGPSTATGHPRPRPLRRGPCTPTSRPPSPQGSTSPQGVPPTLPTPS